MPNSDSVQGSICQQEALATRYYNPVSNYKLELMVHKWLRAEKLQYTASQEN